MATGVKSRSDNSSLTANTSEHGISESTIHRNLKKTYKIPDFQHAYANHPLNPLTAQCNDEAHNFLASHGVDKQVGPEIWQKVVVSAKGTELIGFVFVGTEHRYFLWVCKLMNLVFATDTMMDDGEYVDNPDKCCATLLGVTLSLLWYKPDDKLFLEHVKQINDHLTSDESRALVRAFNEDLLHARNKSKNLLDIVMPPIASALRELWIEYCEAVPAEFLSRQAHAIQDFFLGSFWQTNNRKIGYQIRNVEEYADNRRMSAAVLPFIICSDLLIATSLKFPHIPNSLFYGPEMRSLLLAINDILGWHNDILSFHKEVILAGDGHNLVKILCEERNCSSYTEAGEIALQLIQVRIADMEHAYKQLKAVASFAYHPAIDGYMSLCRDWISGTHQWHFTSPRYNIAETSV